MVEKFLQYLDLEKRYSHHTLKSYRTDLDQLQVYLNEFYDEEKLESISHPILRSWIASLKEKNSSPRTINRKISAVKSFFKWGRKFEYLLADPSQKISVLKTPKPLPNYVEENQMEALKT